MFSYFMVSMPISHSSGDKEIAFLPAGAMMPDGFKRRRAEF
jgi:hypothetical protein